MALFCQSIFFTNRHNRHNRTKFDSVFLGCNNLYYVYKTMSSQNSESMSTTKPVKTLSKVKQSSKSPTQSVDSDLDLSSQKVEEKKTPPKKQKFEDFNIKEAILRGIYAIGWETPSVIQCQAIPHILSGRDVIMQAQSGTGKTGTFTIGLLQQINENKAEIQGIILLPVRELANQVYKVIQNIGDRLQVNFVKCVGKTHVRSELTYPDRATILVGTPGKILDVISNRFIKSQPLNLKIVVIDEFDKMLEEDFIPVIKEIFNFINDETQIVLSSATVNNQVMKISERFMRNPIEITIKEEDVSLEGISQYYVDCEKDCWKFDCILDLYKSLVVTQSVIFVNSIKRCEELVSLFNNKNFSASAIHGNLDQSERDKIMKDYTDGTIRILVTTDLTARGIDVHQVSLVINYELPVDRAQYIHRIGRTGRYGKKGSAINLIGNNYEREALKKIEDFYRIQIPTLPSDYPQKIK